MKPFVYKSSEGLWTCKYLLDGVGHAVVSFDWRKVLEHALRVAARLERERYLRESGGFYA